MRPRRGMRGMAAAALSALLMMMLVSCGQPKPQTSEVTSAQVSKQVQVQAGAVDEAYAGDPAPTLEADYFQSDQEKAEYDPVMKDIQENGLEEQGNTISGI